MTWTNIPNSDVDQDSPITVALMTSLRDNPKAIADLNADAPYVQNTWHPYNGLAVSDGNDGTIYNNADDGNVSSVTTPNFEDGYEYRIIGANLQQSGATDTIELALYRETDGAWTTFFTNSVTLSSVRVGFDFVVKMPRLTKRNHFVEGVYSADGSFNKLDGGVYDATRQAILRARMRPASNNWSAGKIAMFRRKVFDSF